MAELLKIAEAAREMGVSVPSARRALLAAMVPFHKIDRASYISRIDLDLFLASRSGYVGRGRPKKTIAEQPSRVGVSERNVLRTAIQKLAAMSGQDEDVVARVIFHEAMHAVAALLMERGQLSGGEIEDLFTASVDADQASAGNGEGAREQQNTRGSDET